MFECKAEKIQNAYFYDALRIFSCQWVKSEFFVVFKISTSAKCLILLNRSSFAIRVVLVCRLLLIYHWYWYSAEDNSKMSLQVLYIQKT